METRLSVNEILHRQPLFRTLEESEVQQLAHGSRVRRFQRHEMLFQKGDMLGAAYLLIMGRVLLTIPFPQGGEKVVRMVDPGEGFGEAMILLDKPSPITAQAAEESVTLLIERRHLLNCLDKNSQFATRMLHCLSCQLHELMTDIETCTQRGGAHRLVSYLLNLVPPDETDPYIVALPSNKQTLASLLNIAPETLSRVFGQLSSKGLIEVNGRSITILNRGQLERHCN